jgi:DNA-binding transcriptional LysR family regulator
MIRNIDVSVARAFLGVVETGSVTLAARQLNLTQGAISQQIRRLEELSIGRLFVRAGRRVVLTAEGQRLVPTAKQFLAANDKLLAALCQPVFQGEVRFGAPYDIIGSYAPPILRRFSTAFPSIRVSLICRDTIVLLDELKSGRIDIALTTELGSGKGGETLRSDRLVWTGVRDGLATVRARLYQRRAATNMGIEHEVTELRERLDSRAHERRRVPRRILVEAMRQPDWEPNLRTAREAGYVPGYAAKPHSEILNILRTFGVQCDASPGTTPQSRALTSSPCTPRRCPACRSPWRRRG